MNHKTLKAFAAPLLVAALAAAPMTASARGGHGAGALVAGLILGAAVTAAAPTPPPPTIRPAMCSFFATASSMSCITISAPSGWISNRSCWTPSTAR